MKCKILYRKELKIKNLCAHKAFTQSHALNISLLMEKIYEKNETSESEIKADDTNWSQRTKQPELISNFFEVDIFFL